MASKKKAAGVSKNGMRKSHKEVEVKLRVADRAGMLRRLRKLKASQAGPRTHEVNTLYDTQGGALAKRGQLLRVREEYAARGKSAGVAGSSKAKRGNTPSNVLLTYKGPAEGSGRGSNGRSGERRYKVRQEREFRVKNGEGVAAILAAMGLLPWFRYEKYRTTYRLTGLNRLKIEVDETPAGDFLELEGEREDIDRSAKLLGYGPGDYITRSYGSLWGEQRGGGGGEPRPGCGLEDMIFLKAR